MTIRWILLGAIVIAQGCMPLPAPITISNPDRGDSVHFKGMRKQLDSAGALQILVVHGMGPHEVGYSRNLRAHLEDVMKLTRKSDCVPIDTFVSSYGSRSILQRCAFRQAGRRVTVYELTWSELSQRLITERIGYDWTDHAEERVLIDQKLKAGLIDQRFGDAILYTGTFAQTMRDAVAHALCAMMLDARAEVDGTAPGCTFVGSAFAKAIQGPPPAITLISHSLGSYMVFETLATLQDEKDPKDPAVVGAQTSARDFLERLRMVAMLANQLPLLELSRVPAKKDSLPPRPLAFLKNTPLDRLKAATPTHVPILAVSDPNDLLSFPLGAGWPAKLGDSTSNVINVTMANADWVALAVVHPGTAHTRYFDNPCVTRLLVDGDPKCTVAPIFGLHYENVSRAQLNLGYLLHARSPISFPALATIGVSSLGADVGIAKSKGTLVVQARGRVLRTLEKPVEAEPRAWYGGAGVRLSFWTLTAGVDWLWRDTNGPGKARWSFGTGW